jgi:hypothetical protein
MWLLVLSGKMILLRMDRFEKVAEKARGMRRR